MVSFHSADRTLSLKSRTALKAFIPVVFKKEGRELSSISYVFCSDKYLLKINRDFLQHDYFTDIITFDLSEKGMPVEAEIYISTDRVRDNAKALNTSYSQEMLRVIFHGVLHLCGYKDKKKKDILLIRAKEDFFLNLYKKKVF